MDETQRRSKEKIIDYEIYTDGSLRRLGKNMTFGAWGFIVVKSNCEIYEASGSEYNTTNQRMELEAIVQGLKYISTIRRPNERIIIYSDSAYAINCYKQEWYIKWLENGWINSKKETVANKDQWIQLIPYFDHFWYTFSKVEGHKGVFWNEKCNDMVQRETENMKINWRGEQQHE